MFTPEEQTTPPQFPFVDTSFGRTYPREQWPHFVQRPLLTAVVFWHPRLLGDA